MNPNPNPKVDVPTPDPLWQWAIIGSLILAFGRKTIDWLSSMGSWFITKDQSENDLMRTMVDYQQETIRMLIKAKLE